MQSMSDIKHRIKSISQTRQITRAMYLISIAKMRKALEMHKSGEAYFLRVRSVIKEILVRTPSLEHPFLKQALADKKEPELLRDAYIVIAGDKGMAGGYNHSVLNLALEHMIRNSRQKYIFTVGKMSRDFFKRHRYETGTQFIDIAQNPSLENARIIAQEITRFYRENLYHAIFIVYTQMQSSVTQVPQLVRLLPVLVDDFTDIQIAEGEDPLGGTREIIYDPSAKTVLDTLIPQYLIGLIYGTLVESHASEHIARMNAMSSANRNADQMIKDLQLAFNRARQAAITQEMAEIIGGASALRHEE